MESGNLKLGWRRVISADIPRQPQEGLVEKWVREALIRLNPEITAQPDRADEVLNKLRADLVLLVNGHTKLNLASSR